MYTTQYKSKREIRGISLKVLKQCHGAGEYHQQLSLLTFAVFLIKVASLLSMATVGGTPRLNSSLHSSKISSDTKSLSLMLNNPFGT